MAKKKDPATGSADASVLRSGRETSLKKQPTSSPVQSRKSGRTEKHTSPSPSDTKSKLDKIEKQMESCPLRRSDRGKKFVEIPNLSNTRSTKEKTANHSKRSTEDSNDNKKSERQDSDGCRKRKSFTAIHYKALFKPQRIRIESDNDEVLEVEDKSPQANTSRKEDLVNELKTQNSITVEGAPDKDHKAFLEGSLIDLDQIQDGDCPRTKSLDGKSIESVDVEKRIGGNVSPSNGNVANSNNHMFHTSSYRIEHDSENQLELETWHQVTETCKADDIMENAENNHVSSNMQNFKFVEFWVPVRISNVQLEQYCATLHSNAIALCSSSKSDTLDALKDIFTINRKCCNHPYIVDHKLPSSLMKDKEQSMMLDVDIKASGKLQFLDQVLPEIQRRQLKVLILFQPTSGTLSGCRSLGKILVDYVHERYGQNSYEHVDGFGAISTKKQAAVNIFNKEMSRFIFLLESRSCHPSIKLASVDAIIIFDSDLNPSNDLKSLQKVSINSQTKQIMIFRLYTSSTLEEKILKLAENNMAVARSQNLRSYYDAVLTWGASDLFDKLTKFHNRAVLDISSEESLLKDAVEEVLYIISHKSKNNNTSKANIIQVQNCGIYGKNIPLQSEIKRHLPEGEQPYLFWRKLLEGRFPVWKFVSELTPRKRKRPCSFLDSPLEGNSGVDCGVKTRRKTVNNNNNNNSPIESAQLKTVTEGETGGVNEGVPAANNESQSSSGDQFWSIAVNNETNLRDLLKPTVSELCNIFKFSDNVKNRVETFLEYVLNHFQVGKEHKKVLQAFMISLCWIGSSLEKIKIDKSESFALAKKHFSFSCMEEEAETVYKKLKPVKEAYLQWTSSQDCLKVNMPALEGSKLETEKSPHIPSVDAFENGKSHENVSGKARKEFEQIKSELDKNRASLEHDYKLDKSFIHALYSNPSMRSEKLKMKEREFANKLEELERSYEILIKDIKATMLAAEGQVAPDHEFSLRGSQYESQVMQSGNLEVAPTLPENPIEARSHDEPVCEGANDIESTGSHTSEKEVADTTVSSEQIGEVPVQHLGDIEVDVTEKVDPSHENAKGSPSSPNASHVVEDHNETGANDMAPQVESGDMEMPAGGYSKENDEGGTLSHDTPHVNEDRHDTIDDVEPEVEDGEIYPDKPDVCEDPNEISPSHENAIGGTKSPEASHVAEDHNDTGVNDMAPQVEPGMEMQAGGYSKENDEGGTVSLGTSHVNKDCHDIVDYVEPEVEDGESYHDKPDVCDDNNETSPNNVLPHAESAEVGMPVGTFNKESAEDGENYPDKQDVCDNHNESSPRPHVECAEMGTPAGTCEKENGEGGEISPDKPDVGDNHNETSPNDVLPRVESAEMGTLRGTCEKENVEDGEINPDNPVVADSYNETSDNNVLPRAESAEMGSPAATCDKENVEDSETNPDKPDAVLPVDGSAEMGTPAKICEEENAEEGEIIPDKPDVCGDYNEINPNDVLPRAESAKMATPADNEENAEDSILRPDALHANEDHNDSCDYNSSNPECAAAISQDKTPSVQPVFSSTSDHTELIIPEVQNEPLQLEQLPDSGDQDEEIDVGDLQQPAGASQSDHTILDDEPDFPSTDPVVAENPSGMLPPSGPTPTGPRSGENLEENMAAAETPHEEHQPDTSVAPTPPVNALNMFDNIINQVSSQMPNHADPLEAEVERLCTVKDNVTKFYQEMKQRLESEREKEIAELIAQIDLKYEAKHLETDTAYNSKKIELEANINRVNMNQILAKAFRSKCQDLTPSGHPGIQQVSQAGLMQQLHRLSVSPSVRHYPGTPSSSPGQSLGNQQPAQPLRSLSQSPPLQQSQLRPQQPLQIVHQQAALFLNRTPPMSRPPPMVSQSTFSTPPTTSRQLPARPPSNVIQMNLSTTPTISRPQTTVNPVTPSSSTPTTSRLLSGINTNNPSTNRSPPSIGQIDMSAVNLRINTETRGQASHMRPLVSSEPRATALHIRPLVSNEPRAPPPHMRSVPSSDLRAPPPHLRSSKSMPSGPPNVETYRGILPQQHVTTGSSQSPVIPPLSTSSPKSPTTIPSEPFAVPPQPPAFEPCTVPLSSPLATAPLMPSFDNLNGLADNAPRWVNVVTPQPDVRSQSDRLDVTDYIREGTAPASSAPDLVCLSDDD